MTKTKMALKSDTLRVLNTRPSPMGEELTLMCQQNQIQVLFQPMISTDPLNFDDIDNLSESLLNPKQIWLFVSRTAVNQFAVLMKQHNIKFNPNSAVVAVGPGTRAQLLEQFPELARDITCPQKANSESLIQMPELNDTSVNRVWLIKGKGGRPLIKQHLTGLNIPINEVDLYRRVDIQYSAQDILNWLDCQVYLITSVDIGRALIKNVNDHLSTEQMTSIFKEKIWLTVSKRIKTYLQQEEIPNEQIIICERTDNSSIINNINRLAK